MFDLQSITKQEMTSCLQCINKLIAHVKSEWEDGKQIGEIINKLSTEERDYDLVSQFIEQEARMFLDEWSALKTKNEILSALQTVKIWVQSYILKMLSPDDTSKIINGANFGHVFISTELFRTIWALGEIKYDIPEAINLIRKILAQSYDLVQFYNERWGKIKNATETYVMPIPDISEIPDKIPF